MAVLHLNRCKNCRLWRDTHARLPDQFRGGTRPNNSRMCHLRLRETTRNGEPALVPTLDVADDTTPGPKFGQRTKPGDCCKYFVQKHMPMRKAPPVTIQLADAPAEAAE